MKQCMERYLLLPTCWLILLLVAGQPARAAPLFQNNPDCETLRQAGLELQNQGQSQAALQKFQAALVCYQNSPTESRVEQAVVLNNIGAVYDRQGHYAVALENYQQALAIVRKTANRAGEGTILNNIGAVYDRQGRYGEALEIYQQALTLAREAGDQAGQGAIHNNIGEVYRTQGRYDDALAHYQRALAIRRELGDRIGEGSTLNNLGLVYAGQGRYAEALEAYQQALALRREGGDQGGEAITLTNIGFAYKAQGRYTEALASFEQALAIQQKLGDRVKEGITTNNIGELQQSQGRYSAALESYQQALTIRRGVGDRIGEGITLHNIGTVYWAQGHYPEALVSYQQALGIQQEVGDRAGEGATLNSIGAVFSAQGRYPEALTAYEQALAIAREVGDQMGEGATLNNIGSVQQAQGNYVEALGSLEQALHIHRDGGDRAGEGAALNNLGSVYQALGRYAEALENFQRALTIRQEMGDRAGEAATLSSLGSVYTVQGRYTEALTHYQQALTIRQEIGDRAGQGATLNNVGSVYGAQGRHVEALENYQQALLIRREVGDRAGEGATLNSIGSVYSVLGRYDEALTSYQQALVIRQEIGDRAGQGATLNNIGAVYQDQRRYDKALENYQEALRIAQAINNRAGEGTALNNLGAVYQAQKRYNAALTSFRQALHIAREISNRTGEETALNNLGAVYQAQKHYDDALETYQQALNISREVGNRAGKGNILNNMGSVYQAQGRYAEAIKSFQQALAIYQEVSNRPASGATLGNIAGVYQALQRPAEALVAYQQAIDLIESIRLVAGSEQGRAGFIAQYTELYAQAVNLFYQQGQDDAAFLISERGRARAFLDSLATGQVELTDEAAATLLAREREAYLYRQTVQDALARARALNPPDPKLVIELEAQLAEAEDSYAQALAAIAAYSDQLAALAPGRSTVLSRAEVQALLDEQTTLLSYLVLDDKIFVFLITRDTFQIIELKVSRQELTELIQDFYDAIPFRDPDVSNPVTQELYQLLVAPLAPSLHTPRLVIAPHGLLHYLPFAALQSPDTGQYLIERYTLFNLPSPSALPFIQQNAAAQAQPPPRVSLPPLHPALIVGNPTTGNPDLPPLKAATKEVRAIADLYHVQPLLNEAATESAVRTGSAHAGILHLATHGEYNSANPLYSTLYLAPDGANDGRLEVHEVYSLDLSHTELVVLSACQTQLGELSAGDEVVGLTRAFIFAGASTVVATLWNIDDAATSLLMEHFYKHLNEGLDKAAALRQAQLDLLREDIYAAPYYWSAFVLSGDGGKMGLEVNETSSRSAGKPQPNDSAQEANDGEIAPLLFPAFAAPIRWAWLLVTMGLLMTLLAGGFLWRGVKQRQLAQEHRGLSHLMDGEQLDCPICQALNDPDARFCKHCGSSLNQKGGTKDELSSL